MDVTESVVSQSHQTKYHPSYNSPDGDITLLSDDGVNFRVHSFVLSRTSKFFREMMEIPQPEGDTNVDPLPMGESSAVIKAMLDIIYPGDNDPKLPSLTYEFLRRLLSAADRFDMSRVNHYVRLLIPTDKFSDRALEYYALACAYGWVEEAHDQSVNTLNLRLLSPKYETILTSLDSASLYRLFKLREQLKSRIVRVAQDLEADEVEGMWECDCEDGELEAPEWKVLASYVSEKFDDCANGNFLRTPEFWDDERLHKLWKFECRHCNRPWLKKENLQRIFMERLDSALAEARGNR
ncbi:hypothetical protein BD410DRAFT_825735 [Rickenella mellea]|uniref:BTB domain-containing protein n=1 Tax=Rickenella mellea TaxID=50990 RepID=A0A4Y7QFZ7_9AGAM|nr:hypothetical protein BD410DRAFT_825735 [Rickenella mellea]